VEIDLPRIWIARITRGVRLPAKEVTGVRESVGNMRDKLIWDSTLGMGYLPHPLVPYDEDYFQKYVGYAETEQGVLLNQARVRFVKHFWDGEIVDVGCAAGQFCEIHGNALGYDVMPQSRSVVRWSDFISVDAASFWDVLEHMPDPVDALSRVKRWAFITIPVHDGKEEWLNSKHLRPGEHLWYWSVNGFVRWLLRQGFVVESYGRLEEQFGREDVATFAARRK